MARRRPAPLEVGLAVAGLAAGVLALSQSTSRAPAALGDPPPSRGAANGTETALLADEGARLLATRAFPQACQRLSEASEREPASVALRDDVARCFGRWGWQALRAGRPEEALALFQHGLAHAHDGGELLAGLGVAAIHAGRTEEALQALEGSVRVRPDPDVSLLLARLYDQQDDPGRAVTHLERLVARRDGPDEARRLLGKLRREQTVESGFRREETPHFVVKYRDGVDGDGPRMVTDVLESLYDDIATELGYRPADRIVVILYPAGRLQEVTGAHQWVNGLFDGKIRLPERSPAADATSLERVLAHELTHAVVHQASRGRAPRWLHEGLAQHFEGAADEDLMRLPRGLTLAGLEALLADGDPAKAQTGYRTALWLIRDLIERGGVTGIAALLSRLSRGEAIAAAVPRVYGLPLSELEFQWRRVLGG